MLPVLIKLGPFELSSFGVFCALALLALAFETWRVARDRGLPDEKILDNVIVVTIFAFIGARLAYVVLHWDVIAPNLLRLGLIWKFPGYSVWGALIFGLIAFILYTGKQKLPRSVMFDGYGSGIPAMAFFLSLAVFFDGNVVGKTTSWFTGMSAVGEVGKRHPVALYSLVLTVLFGLLIYILRWRLHEKQNASGVVGWTALSGIGFIQLILAFFRADLPFIGSISLVHMAATILAIAPLTPLFVLLEAKTFLVTVKEKVGERLHKHYEPKNKIS